MEVLKFIQSRLYGKYLQHEADTLAKIIIAHVCDVNYHSVLQYTDSFTEAQSKKLMEILDRLDHFEPIQYILNEAPFYGLNLFVNRNTLIPRPETEELVDLLIKDVQAEPSLSIVDFGSGSGCISLAIKKYCPQHMVYGIDTSTEALIVSSQNAEKYNLQVHWIQDDILSLNFDTKVDVIISNPPYIHRNEACLMENQVLLFEPELALFVNQEDTIIFYRKIVEFAQNYLCPDGRIYFEINPFYVNELQNCLYAHGFFVVEIKKDMQEKNRFIKAFRKK